MPVLALFRVHPALSKFLWIFRDFRLEWRGGNSNVLPSGQIIGDKRNKRNADLRIALLSDRGAMRRTDGNDKHAARNGWT
ncbi:hypothetical protein J2857_000798 [Neorhizobium galegae]|uniref:hypothetical protein n=1 Tax=Neorhizobium galegae TaxID=399 RepID=UPI001AE2F0A4|nr:hypothetical protein [Neorhizobium galegae]MBP2558047.1 hypothetical protein [Neorhizobium galegae]